MIEIGPNLAEAVGKLSFTLMLVGMFWAVFRR